MRPHLSYANVTATLALVVALATGGAYAADLIGSDEIRDNSIRSEDLRDRVAVRGPDVATNSLDGREIREQKLVGTRLVGVAGAQTPECEVSGATSCASTSIRLRREGVILATATGAFFGDGDAAASCEVQLDGAAAPISQTPGETTASTSDTATDGFARTALFRNVTRGSHDVALTCSELVAEAVIDTPSILVLAVTGP